MSVKTYLLNDLDMIKNSFPSICIPNVNYDISTTYMYEKFNKLFKYNVKRIDFIIKNKRGIEVKQYFIHLKEWYRNDYLDTFRLKLLNKECVNVVYEHMNYFKCYMSISKISNK